MTTKCPYCQMLDIESGILDNYDRGCLQEDEVEDLLREVVGELEEIGQCRCGDKQKPPYCNTGVTNPRLKKK